MRPISLSLVLASITSIAIASAISAPPSSKLDINNLPDFLLREEIPEGVTVVEADDSPEAHAALDQQLEGSSANVNFAVRRELEKRSDCNGSGGCALYVEQSNCRGASGRYDNDVYYCGYHSRVSKSCTAIWTCASHAACMRGSWLKQQFENIYAVVKCGRCGTYTVPDGDAGTSCRATYNYCTDCKDV